MSTSSTSLNVDWEFYAQCYDGLLHLRPYSSMISEVATIVSGAGHKTILDASCGTGNFGVALASLSKNNQGISLFGVDASPEMLKRAKQKYSQFDGRNIKTKLKYANLNEKLPFEDGAFDCVVSINTLYAVNNPAVTLSEFGRVLKPGGEIVLVTPKQDYENGFILRDHLDDGSPFEEWLNAHESPEREKLLIQRSIKDNLVVEQMLTIARYNRQIAKSNTYHFFEPDLLGRLFFDCGFRVRNTSSTYAKQGILVTARRT